MAFSGFGAQAASSPSASSGASSSGTPSGSSNSPSTSRPTPSQRASGGGNAFAPKRPSTLSNSFRAGDSDADGDVEEEDGEEDEQVGTLHTIPPAFGRGGKRKWVDSGRSLGVGVGGAGGETVLWVRKKVSVILHHTPLDMTMTDRVCASSHDSCKATRSELTRRKETTQTPTPPSLDLPSPTLTSSSSPPFRSTSLNRYTKCTPKAPSFLKAYSKSRTLQLCNNELPR